MLEMERAGGHEHEPDQIRLEFAHVDLYVAGDRFRSSRVPARAMSGDDAVALVREPGGIARLRIARPQTRNAMSAAMWSRFAAHVADVAQDRTVRALVVHGTADAFVSGADIGDFRSFAGPADGLAYEAAVGRALDALERLPIVTVAAIAGACTGGGAILACACDVRIGAANARVGVPVARTVGNITTAANVARLAAIVGRPKVLQWLLTARLDDAEAAHAAGFFTELVASFDDALARARELGAEIAANAPHTIAAAKELARRMLHATIAHVDDRDLMERCYGSEDFAEGVRAFVAKRPAAFTGR
ncbi:MAG: enoyl-CoA hydratase/isomerase family protein [Vulcanimicrobiaceae bacterium]